MERRAERRRAMEDARTKLNAILDVYEGRDFIEITGKAGNDTITLRYYDNGKITEK